MTAAPIREWHAYPPRLMSESEAARYLSIGTTTLRKDGPTPKRHGRRVLYDIRDLDRWADALSGLPLDEGAKGAEGDDIHRRVMERLGNGNG